jgi:ribosomal protein L37AE/L43A
MSNVRLHTMSLPRVYADFNAIEYPPGVSFAEMPLTGFGTLGSLARQGLRLSEGMALVLFEPNDIECEATVHFDWSRTDPAGRKGEWVARFDHRLVRDIENTGESAPQEHPCIVCGKPFEQHRAYTDVCVNCGTSVMEPMLPPSSAT